MAVRYCLLAALRARTGIALSPLGQLAVCLLLTLVWLMLAVAWTLAAAVLVPRVPRRRKTLAPVPLPAAAVEVEPETPCADYQAWSESLSFPPVRTPLTVVQVPVVMSLPLIPVPGETLMNLLKVDDTGEPPAPGKAARKRRADMAAHEVERPKAVRSKVRPTAAGNWPLCDGCDSPWTDADVDEDGYTEPAECCERVGLCARCREHGQHECDEPRKTAVDLAMLPVARLRQLAAAAGHKGSRLMRKAELLTLLN